MDNVGMARASSEHQCGLVVVVESGIWILVAGGNEDLTDVTVAEGGREVQIGVGEALGCGVWVVQ
jgi:hypothetical protein